jgi:hypothetical protein
MRELSDDLVNCEFTRDELQLLLMAVNAYKYDHEESSALGALDSFNEGTPFLDYLQELALS